MKRTRKWEFVKQEAGRLAAMGLAPRDIAHRLGVNKSTVTRWFTKGHLVKPTTSSTAPTTVVSGSPEEWAREVRQSYSLDATDDQLVSAGELALRRMYDPLQPASVQLAAMGRFQAIAKQLALVARNADEKPAEAPKAATVERPMRRAGPDPRLLLMALKSG